MAGVLSWREMMAIDQDKLNDFLGKAVGDIGAVVSADMVLLGDKLDLCKAISDRGSSSKYFFPTWIDYPRDEPYL